MSPPPRARELGVMVCHVCGLIMELLEEERHAACPRCRSALHGRRGRGPWLTWLLLLAAIAMYVPANLMPVMEIHLLGQGAHAVTIMGGIVDLWRDESYDLASVVFFASVALPCAKLMTLGGLLWSVQWRMRFACRQRARLHRLLELIGYWSMLDVLVVSTLGSLVQFQALGEVHADAGIFFFGASVILTMLAAHSFDARLIWDAVEVEHDRTPARTGDAATRRRAP